MKRKPPGGGGAQLPAGTEHQEANGGPEDNKRKGGVGWGGAGTAAGLRQILAHSREPRRHEKAEGEQGKTSGRATTAAKRKHGVAHPTAREAGPSDQARTKGWRTTSAREASPSEPARKTPKTTNSRQRRPYGGGDNNEPTKQAEHRAVYNTTNQKPKQADTTGPTKGGGTHKHGTPQQGGGSNQQSTNPGQANNTTATATHPTGDDNPSQPPPPRRAGTNAARPGKRGATHQHNTLQHEGHKPTPQVPPWGVGTPTQHTPPWGGPRKNTARPNRGGGGTHQHSTNPGQANTTDNQHRTTPDVRRQRQQRTNKTSRAWSRLQHHEPKPKHADTARPTKVGGTHKHGTPQ